MATAVLDARLSKTIPVTLESLPDYRLLQCLWQNRHGEVWRVRAIDGRVRALKIIYPFARQSRFTSQDHKYVNRLRNVQHPALAPVEAVEIDQGRLAIVTELAVMTLKQRLEECRQQHLDGIPREELLAYLLTAAEGLDYLRKHHNLQHLGLNPGNLVLLDGKLLIADFGLVESLWIPAGQPVAPLNPRYAAPELFEQHFNWNSDQYSLALIYQEMLTGRLPTTNYTIRQLKEERLQGDADLDLLPEHDHPAVRQALSRDPANRFGSCTGFVQALYVATEGLIGHAPIRTPTSVVLPSRLPVPPEIFAPGEQSLGELVHSWVRRTAELEDVQEFNGLRYRLTLDGVLRHKTAAWLPGGVAQHKLEGFLQGKTAEVVHFDPLLLIVRFYLPKNFWQKMRFGRRHAVEAQIQLTPPPLPSIKLTEVSVRMRYLDGSPAEGRETVHTYGPLILEELHTHLLATPERRIQERFQLQSPLRVSILAALDSEKQVECRGKDISFTGIGFYAPFQPPSGRIFVYQQNSPEESGFPIPAAVMRVQKTADGWYEAGARFLVGQGQTQ